MPRASTHYEVLGLTPQSSPADIRAAYVRLARRHHPDTGGDVASMRLVNEAWRVLSDADKRRIYDHHTVQPAGSVHDSAVQDDSVIIDLRDDPSAPYSAGAADDDRRAGPDHSWTSAARSPASARRAAQVDQWSLLLVLTMAGLAAVNLFLGMMLTKGELLGLGILFGFLTCTSTVARVLLAMRHAT